MLSGQSVRCLPSLKYRYQSQCLGRTSTCWQPLSRAFHSSRPNQLLFELVEPLSQAIHWGFQEIHTQTGIPWYLTIPLGASVLRMTGIPIQIWTSRLRKPRETVTQLTSAWRKAYQETARIKYPLGT